MAIYKSNAKIKNANARPDSQVEPAESTFTVTIPAGVSLAADDLLYFGKLGEGVDVISVAASFDAFDSAGTGVFDMSLGVVPAATAEVVADVIASTINTVASYQCFWPETQANSAGAGLRFNLQKDSGGGTGGTFNLTPYQVSTTPVDIVAVVGTVPTTAITNVARNVTIRVKYQYAYPGQLITGVDDPTYPWAGDITYGTPIQYTYGAGQDGTPNAP